MKSTVIAAADIQWLDYVWAQKLNIGLTVKRVLKWGGVIIVVAIHYSVAVSVCR